MNQHRLLSSNCIIITLTVIFSVHSFAKTQTIHPSVKSVVEAEEIIRKHINPNNGSGPLWCYGSTVIARDEDNVYVSVNETGPNVPLLCNTRWQLWHKKGNANWKLVQTEQQYRHREPCPVAIFPGRAVFLSVNPSTEPPGVKYGHCKPKILEFKTDDLSEPFKTHLPTWADGTYFTDHSYKGFAADSTKGELLLLNINAKTSEQFVSYMDSSGKWYQKGKVKFPIRACYPQVALRNKAAHIMAIGDILEPVERWQKIKAEKLSRKHIYVFRRLFYTFTPDIRKTAFTEPVEIDSVEATCGSIRNQDLYIDNAGTAHLLYIKRPHLYKFIRNAEFPDQNFYTSLEYATIKNNRIISRRTLLKYSEGDSAGIKPSKSRFHIDAADKLYVITIATDMNKKTLYNYIARISENVSKPEFSLIELKKPFSRFLTANTRAGCKPSDVIDMFGQAVGDSSNLRYARIRLY